MRTPGAGVSDEGSPAAITPAPEEANAAATARPIPLVPPVTSTVRPLKSKILNSHILSAAPFRTAAKYFIPGSAAPMSQAGLVCGVLRMRW